MSSLLPIKKTGVKWLVFIRRLLLVLFLIFGLACLYSFFDVVNKKQEKSLKSLELVTGLVAEQSNKLSEKLKTVEPIVFSLADDIHQGKIAVKDIHDRLNQDLSANTWLFGIGLAVEPYKVFDDQKLWSRYYTVIEGDTIKRVNIGYDYTSFDPW